MIESTNLKYFTKEFTAEFYALKGMFLAQIGRSEDANKAFSAAVQMHDTLVKAWALWGDYLETVFTRDSKYVSYHASGKFYEFNRQQVYLNLSRVWNIEVQELKFFI